MFQLLLGPHPGDLHPHRLFMLAGVNLLCFTASYFVSLSLEGTRLFFRAPVRMLVIMGFTLAGLLAHTLYLYHQAEHELSSGTPVPLSSWYDWCLLASWVMAAAYLGLVIRRPETAVGIFLLPLVLILIGLAVLFRNTAPFPQAQAMSYWRLVHGVALLLGTVAVTLGFATGVMYLVQAYRLKHKLPPRPGFRLPTLEWLQRFNREAILISSGLLFVGLVAGIVINLAKRAVPWTDPVIVSSGVLFSWLIGASMFEWLYRPAWQGSKVAYLTMASFVFLVMVLGFVLFREHPIGRGGEAEKVPPAGMGWRFSQDVQLAASNSLPESPGDCVHPRVVGDEEVVAAARRLGGWR